MRVCCRGHEDVAVAGYHGANAVELWRRFRVFRHHGFWQVGRTVGIFMPPPPLLDGAGGAALLCRPYVRACLMLLA